MAGVTRIGPGTYRVEYGGGYRTVYVADGPDGRWAFCDGEVYHFQRDAGKRERTAGGRAGAHAPQPLSSPMPATVVRVLVSPGTAVKKGDTVLVAEAMKMELPIRAPADGIVTAVRCREGELVQPDQVLVELE